jgi:hypothetical protein
MPRPPGLTVCPVPALRFLLVRGVGGLVRQSAFSGRAAQGECASHSEYSEYTRRRPQNEPYGVKTNSGWVMGSIMRNLEEVCGAAG